MLSAFLTCKFTKVCSMKSEDLILLMCASIGVISSSTGIDVTVHVGRQVIQCIDEKFVGVALDSSLFEAGWHNFNFTSKKLINLAMALSPCYLRVGGTAADCLIFDPNKINLNSPAPEDEEQFHSKDCRNFTMPSTDWDHLNKFSSTVDWNIIFDLNVLLRQNGHWDISNAEVLLNYTKSHGYKVAGFQLGNEPDAFHHVFDLTIKASELAQNFYTLQQLLHRYPQYRDSLIIGPDVTQISKINAKQYLEEFLASGGGKVVNKATFHQYYVDGHTASVEDFTDPSVLNRLTGEITTAINITNTYSPTVPVWLGETGSAFGGGAPGISDAYVAGFMWLDKLGISAKFGLKGVIRQSFYHGHYSMLDEHTLDPLPDYWLTVLYKRLVGRLVFNVTTSVSTDSIRMYGHCSNTNRYVPGSLTLYALNLKTEKLTLSLPQFTGTILHIYWLTPHGDHGLKSRRVQLNGKTLKLEKDKLPRLDPVQISSTQICVPAKSFGFIVIPGAQVDACTNTHPRVS